MPAQRTPPHLVTLILLTALSTLSLNMFLPSLAHMSEEFQVPYSLMALSVSGYLAFSAVLQLCLGPLSDRVGRRPVLLSGLALFIAASVVCLLAPDIETFLAGRMVQAAIISGSALSSAVVRDTRPADKTASTLGYITMAMAVAPMLGPMIGGGLDELFGWRASFVAFATLGTALFILTWFDLGETRQVRDRKVPQHIAYLQLIRTGRFWAYASCMAFSVAAFYAFITGVPLVAQTAFDIKTSELGFWIGTITAGFFVGSFLSGRFAGRVPLPVMMLAGRLTACTGLSIGIILFALGASNQYLLFGATIFVGIGNGLTTPSANAGGMSVKPDLAGSAAGLTGALTVLCGAIVTTLTGSLLTIDSRPIVLLGIMLTVSALGLVSALAAYFAEATLKRDKAVAAG